MKARCKIIFLLASALASCSLSATALYNVTFSTNDVGTYEVVSGNPSVQASVGPFTDALVFHAIGFDAGASYDVIQLPLPPTELRYNIQFDVLTHNLMNSQHAFQLLLDTVNRLPQVYFHGGQNSIGAFQPFPYTIAHLTFFSDDRPYHFDISVDLQAHRWSVAVDGVQLYDNSVSESILEGIRFSMQPWIGGAVSAPATYAALDNVVISAIPQPSSCPSLKIQQLDASRVRLAWPTNFVGYALEHTTNVLALAWTADTNTQTVVADQFTVTTDSTIGQRFYRLRRPQPPALLLPAVGGNLLPLGLYRESGSRR